MDRLHADEEEDDEVAVSEEYPMMGSVPTEGPLGYLESDEERRKRKRSINVTVLLSYIGSVVFSVTLPSLALYLASFSTEMAVGADNFFGIVMAVFSLGQLVTSPFVGWWFNRSSARAPFILCMLLLMGGSLLYALARDPYTVLASRFIVGCSFSVVTVALAYTSLATTDAERPATVSLHSAAQALGFVTGPIIGAAMSLVEFNVGLVAVNQFTAPGFISCVFGLAGLCALAFFDEFRPTAAPQGGVGSPRSFPINEYFTPKLADGAFKLYEKWSLAVVIVVFFIISNVFAVFETVAAPFLIDNYGFGVQEIGFFFCGCAAIAVCGLVASRPLGRRFPTRVLLLLSTVLLSAGPIGLAALGVVPVPLARYLCFSAVLSAGFPLSQSFCLSLAARILGPTSQVALMRYVTSAGSLARVLGPLWGMALFGLDVSGRVVYISLFAVALAAPLLVAAAWRKLAPSAVYFPAGPTSGDDTGLGDALPDDDEEDLDMQYSEDEEDAVEVDVDDDAGGTGSASSTSLTRMSPAARFGSGISAGRRSPAPPSPLRPSTWSVSET